MKTSAKIEVQLIVDACKRTGVNQIVLSPGSRNAPLSIAFDEDPFFKVVLIPDERSAAFVALGLAQQSKNPVVIACTSGSAPLNYYPAVVEAFYQQIPLIVLTADRPAEWTDQGDGQTIRQQQVFGTHVLDFEQLNPIKSEDDRWFFERKLCKAFHSVNGITKGPIHLNVPFSEPLYETTEHSERIINWANYISVDSVLTTENKSRLSHFFNSKKKQLIIVGQNWNNSISNELIQQLINSSNCVVLTEHTSNLNLANAIDRIDQALNCMDEKEESNYYPDLIVQLGDAIISKKIKRFLRNSKAPVVRVNQTFTDMDVFQNLQFSIPVSSNYFLSQYLDFNCNNDQKYFNDWMRLNQLIESKHSSALGNQPYSDLKVVASLMELLKDEMSLHVSNSSMIRYVLLNQKDKNVSVFCNRGTSGIDGSTSTAVGAALNNPDKRHVMLTGDLSFFYDSNALWNNCFPKNLTIVLVNNGGGDIFNIIPGPDSTNQHKKIFVAEQNFTAEKIAANFNLSYRQVENLDDFKAIFSTLRTQIIEVNTMKIENAKVLKDYFKEMRAQ